MLGEARGVFDEERLIYTGIVEIGREREREREEQEVTEASASE